MDRITRKGLKTDRFAEEVTHTVDYVSEHRSQFIRYGAAALAVIVVAAAFWLYTKHQRTVRQEELRAATRILEATVGSSGNEYMVSFPTQAAKDAAVLKAFNELIQKYPNKDEGLIARYFLAMSAADRGDLGEAEKSLKVIADSGNEEYGSAAKLSLAQIYESQGKYDEAEKMLRPLVDKPTIMVSKEQATIALGRLLTRAGKGAEGRKLLEPLRSARSVVSRAALNALSEAPAR